MSDCSIALLIHIAFVFWLTMQAHYTSLTRGCQGNTAAHELSVPAVRVPDRTCQPDSQPLDLDAHGWVRSLQPGQTARTLMFWGGGGNGGFGGHYPGGRYVVQYEGSGTIVYGGGARRVESSPGRDILQVDPAMGGISMIITAVNPANYLRNIRMLMPVNAPVGEIFYPP